MRLAVLFVVLLASSCYAQFTGKSCTQTNNAASATMSCVVNGVTSGNKLIVFYTISTNIGGTCGSVCTTDSLGSTYTTYCITGGSGCGASWGYQFGDILATSASCNGSPCTSVLNLTTLASSGNVTVTVANHNLIAYEIVMEYAAVGSNDVSNSWCAGDAIFCATRQATGTQSVSVTTSGNPDIIIEFNACSDSCTTVPIPGASYTQQLTLTAPFSNSSGRTMRISVADRHLLPASTYTVDADIGGTGTAAVIVGWAFGDNSSTGFSGDAQIL